MQLPAKATITEAGALLAQLDAAADANDIDAGALQDFDTSAVALLLEARRRAHARGAAFAVHNVPPKLRELARLYGVDELLSLGATT